MLLYASNPINYILKNLMFPDKNETNAGIYCAFPPALFPLSSLDIDTGSVLVNQRSMY